MKRKILAAFCILSLCLIALGACAREAEVEVDTIFTSLDYISFPAVDNLSAWASHVVIAEILDERVEFVNTFLDHPYIHPYKPFTINTIRILEVFQGGFSAGYIREVSQLGGMVENTNLVNHDKTPLPVGSYLVLFLSDNLTHVSGPLGLLNPSQSAYYLTEVIHDTNDSRGDGQYFGIMQAYDENLLGEDMVFESVSDQNPLSLTVGELMRIAEAAGNR